MKKTEQLHRDQWIAYLIFRRVLCARSGEWDGTGLTPYFQSCRESNPFRGLTTIFSRDVGYHTSGWWKNPDYERCYHLSLSFFEPMTQAPRQYDKEIASKLVAGFFTKFAKWVWVEPPYSPDGHRAGVIHYRLFCDEAWQPIKPRGEVYSRELTESGWHSFSDVQEAIATTGENPNLS